MFHTCSVSQLRLGLFQVLNSHIRLVPTVLDSAILEGSVYTVVYELLITAILKFKN